MESAPNPPRPVPVYSRPTRTLAVVAGAICALLAVNLVMTGTAEAIWKFLPWLLLIAWAVFVLLWRPRLLVHADGLTVHNLLRDHDIPFSALTALRVVHTVSLDTTAGRIASWGAPGAGKLGPRRLSEANGGPSAFTLPTTQATIEYAWDAWERSHPDSATSGSQPGTSQPGTFQPGTFQPGKVQRVETRWNAPVAVAGVFLLLLVTASLLIR